LCSRNGEIHSTTREMMMNKIIELSIHGSKIGCRDNY